MSLLAQLVDIKPPLKFLLLIFPSLCNSRVCNEKVFSCYHTPYRQSRLLGSILDSSGIYQGSIMEPFQSHPGTIQDLNLYTHAMNLQYFCCYRLALVVCMCYNLLLALLVGLDSFLLVLFFWMFVYTIYFHLWNYNVDSRRVYNLLASLLFSVARCY